MNIYVGNLSHEATEDDLRQAFEAFTIPFLAIVISRESDYLLDLIGNSDR